MKKTLALVLCVLMAVSLFAGCNASNQTKDETVKTGLAVITTTSKSKDAAADADGLAQSDSVVVAVNVDKNGKIVACKIDTAQTKINFSAEGKVTTDLTKEFASKQNLAEEYGMKKASGIGKEWYEQANAFAKYVVGKTVAEVKGMKLNDEGAPAESDLTSSVTMHVTDYIAAIEKAVNNAKDAGAKSSDKLGLGVVTHIDKAADATAEKEGTAQAYTFYAAVNFAADGKISSCTLDASQTNVKFDTTGKITSDINSTDYKTKMELGEAYGMKKASGIGKEWSEQCEAFAKYAVGKTAAQVTGIAVNEKGAPAESDLTSSVTVTVTEMIKVIELAAVNAK